MGSSVEFFSEATFSTDKNFNDVVSRGRFYNTRETDIRKRLSLMTAKENNISSVYKESLRAMISTFNDVGYIDGQNGWKTIPVIYANPERAIAKLKQETNIILPIISVAQTVSNSAPERWRYDSLLINQSYWDEVKHKAIRVLSFAPRAINIMYNVNIWAKYNEDIDQILEQIRLKFCPEMTVPTKFSTLTKASIESEENVGSVEANDKEDRILKKVISVSLKTYIPNPRFLVTSTGSLERVNIEGEIY